MADGRHCENRRITIYAYVHSIFAKNSVRLSIGDLTTGLAFWHCAHSMRSRVHKTVRCPSVRPSVCQSVPQSNAAAACGGFAAERRTRKDIDRQRRAPGSSSAAARAAARRSAVNAGNVTLTAEYRLNTYLGYFLLWNYHQPFWEIWRSSIDDCKETDI